MGPISINFLRRLNRVCKFGDLLGGDTGWQQMKKFSTSKKITRARQKTQGHGCEYH